MYASALVGANQQLNTTEPYRLNTNQDLIPTGWGFLYYIPILNGLLSTTMKKIELHIPTDQSEITVEQYQKFARLPNDADPEFLARKMLSIFCHADDVLKFSLKDVNDIFKILKGVLSQRPKLKQRFTLGGKEFGFIPNLSNITFGEFIDLEETLSWEDMPKALSILYRPITKSDKTFYEIEPYETTEKYSDLMRSCPLDVAIGASVFFWTIASQLSKSTLTSLKSQKELASSQPGGSSPLDGDGLQLLTALLMETLPSTMPSAALPQHRPFPLLPTKAKKTS